MHPLVLMPLAACVVCSAYCLTTRPADFDPANRRLRWLSKLLFVGPAFWAFGEVGLGLAKDPGAAENFVPLTAAAIVLVGPISTDLAVTMSAPRAQPTPRWVIGLYAVAGLLVVLQWATGACYSGVVAVPWGYALESGPWHFAYLGFVFGCGTLTYVFCRGVIADTMTVDANPAGRWITGGILLLMSVGTVTDGILPILGIQVPRLTTLGFAALAAALLWSMSRPQGYIFASQQIISREILRSIHEGVVFVTLEDRVLLANEGMETFLGAPASEIVGRPFQHHVPELALDGPQERIDVECQLHSVGGEQFTVAASISTARDSRGEVLGLVVVVRDLRQVEQLRSQLVTSGRLAAVGQLAAGIAHEINNPLAFVRTNLGVLRDHWHTATKALAEIEHDAAVDEALREGDEIITESIEGVDRAAHIVRDVREFSHAGRPERERIDLNDLLDRVLRISAPEIGPGVRIERAYGELPPVPASPQQLKQVFLNLIVNAIHAVEGEGTVRVETSAEPDQISVRVRDDGPGVERAVAERIFDPFFTTKSVGDGTGLGLSISHQIIQGHGGEIALETERPAGACFRVTLPTTA